MAEYLARITNQSVGVKIGLVLAVIFVIGLLFIGAFFALGTFFFYDSYSSSYHYSADIYIDGGMENAVFILPIGVLDDEVTLGELHLSESDRFDGVDHRIIETDYGPMLRIEIDEITPGRDVFWIDATLAADGTIETKSPRTNEPILAPLELTGVEISEDGVSDQRSDRRSFDATSLAYIEFDGPEAVDIGLSVRYGGTNEWWSFGWSWNEYETVVVANEAPRDPNGEWIELTGWHTEGAGSYPSFPFR